MSTSTAQDDLLFNVGAAESVISPNGKAYIAGHSHNRLFNGIHDDIFVKAAVIENDSTHIIILTFDCIGLLYTELQSIRDRVKLDMPAINSGNIVMTSTHTHSGPDVVGLWGKNLTHSGIDPYYLKNLIAITVKTIGQAWDNRQLASADYAFSTHGDDWVYNISEPMELDRSLTVLRFKDQKEDNVLSLTNFACHPTFLDAVNDSVSSDYVGGYYQRMNELYGGVNMFLQGSIGGWIQPEHEEKSFRQAFYRGYELADKVKMTLDDPTPLISNELKFSSHIFNLPVENPGFVQLSKMGVINREFGDSVSTEIAYFNIGNASFATHPGETVPAMSLHTKEMMKNEGPKFIMGLGMDALGYILKPHFFDKSKALPHSEYLCSVSLGPKTMESILHVLRQLIQSDE